MRPNNSVRMAKSNISGAASKESSQVLWMLMVAIIWGLINGRNHLRQSISAAKKDFGIVLIKSTLGISHGWDIFDHNNVVGRLSRLKSNKNGVKMEEHSGMRREKERKETLYRIELLWTMSSTTLLFEISFDRNCGVAERLSPSLLPR